MSEIIMYTSLDLAIIGFEMVIAMIVYAIVKTWYDNKKFEKNSYQILEQYRAKYGVDEGCEMLMYNELEE